MAPKKKPQKQSHRKSTASSSSSSSKTSQTSSSSAPRLQISAENENRLRRLLLNCGRSAQSQADSNPQKNPLSKAQKAKKLKAVYEELSCEGFSNDQAFSALKLSQSEPVNELCSKILTQTDVKVRLSFPTATMMEHFKLESAQSVDFRVRDNNCKVWTFRLYTRKKDSHPKPVLTKGWIEFVQKNELIVGDKVIFLVHQNGDQLGIKVERNIALMGKGHWAQLF